MDALKQRLNELEPHVFEDLCFNILKERHPPLRVEGATGDMGLDIFEGELSGQQTVWHTRAVRTVVKNSKRIRFENLFGKSSKKFPSGDLRRSHQGFYWSQ
jgi:hypothetical protein